MNANSQPSPENLHIELEEWRDSLQDVLKLSGTEQVKNIIDELEAEALKAGVEKTFHHNTPFINTIPPSQERPYPGSREIERRIKSLIRWNAMAMVVRANKELDGIGGHISTYASSATLLEVGFNHFWRAPSDNHPGDLIYFQGHSSPGIYSRAFVEGRLTAAQLKNFRRELADGGGLSSYPHPWLMPEFWQFPTVSMGLGPITAIYHARFIKYLENRGLKPASDQKVWAFLGDGECDEVETLGPISIAGREKLDNLNFVINCNLQRLDGPVRGNGQIVQELEARFRAAGWNVIKVLWSSDWDPLFAKDTDGWITRRLSELVDGEMQKYSTLDGAYLRKNFFGKYPQLAKLVEDMSDDEIRKLRRGGHDPDKVYNAYARAMETKGAPTCILAMTVKGYGLGESGEGKNVTHNQKKLNENELREFRTRFGVPLSDEQVENITFYKPGPESVEIRYLQERRAALGGYIPQRRTKPPAIELPADKAFEDFLKGSAGKEASTTMIIRDIMLKLLREPGVSKLIVPIIPDEARTFGMEGLFRQIGIYSSVGQLYEPVDKDVLMYYRESKEGQLLQEGINEAGAMASFVAAGTAFSNHGINTIPFYIYYSMFGLQRVGDMAWLAGDARCKGFLVGGTAGRTTLNGEGLQHEDGHSHVIALTIPNCRAYDPAYAFEVAVIVQDGIKRMYADAEDVYYYITVMNENYAHPPMPEGAREGIIKGLYKLYPAKSGKAKANLIGSGSILNEVVKAQEILREKYKVDTDVYSATSYKALQDDALACDRWNLLHPGEKARVPYITEVLSKGADVTVTSSDYMKTLSDGLARWIPGRLRSLGTNGFGRSESRANLRDFFEVDHRYVVLATLTELAAKGEIDAKVARQAVKDLGIDAGKRNPLNT
ncbi:MAG: pyruvate dehydrogenase (acetyl-transferring), homodimeric type [Kiritimatiellia bacterium]